VSFSSMSGSQAAKEFWYIRAELGRVLAVVNVTSQVNGNAQFSGSRHPKTTRAINKDEIWHN